ncbi:MAG: restriction endonuclease subunit S, partial [Candidatus Gastranaerophilaceae bacterium]
NANDKLCYPLKEEQFAISERDFKQCIISSILFDKKIDENDLHKDIIEYLFWGNKSNVISKGLLEYFKEQKSNINIDVSEWGEYSPVNLFEFEHPSARSSKNYENGNVPFVYSGSFNNGVEKFVNPKNEKLDKPNCISLSPVDCSAFYQEYPFLGRGGGGSSIYLLRNEHLNKYNALFICAVLKKFYGKYYYDNQLSETKFKKEFVCLPYKTDDEPDWEYMEKYIRNLYDGLKSIVED